ncbi:MAG: MCP four helix bundle domain-containing protein, partial [Thermoguttaceae bacterium]
MFANLKTRTKILSGFGIMLLILAGLGTAGYVMFGQVQSNMIQLADHNLGAVKHSTGVERAAFEAIVEEKNYVLYKQDEIHERAKKKLSELAANLDRVDQVAQQFGDTALAEKSKEVRDLATQFGESYEQGVAALKANKSGEETMDAKGTLVGSEATAYMAAKKAEYMQAKNALAIVNRINATAYNARLQARTFMAERQQQNMQTLETCISELLAHYDALDKLNPDEAEKKQINEARKATSDYLVKFKAWVDEDKKDSQSPKLVELSKQLVDTGNIVAQAAKAYLEAKQATVDKVADAVFIVAEIANEANTTRLNEKGYILNQDQEHWTALNEHITKLDSLYDDLRKVSLTQEDQQRIERADTATQEYLVAAKAWVDNDNQLRNTILPAMKKGGETVLATAQTAENDAWKAADTANATVNGIVGTSKRIIVFSLVVGVVAVLVLGYTISASIAKILRMLVGESKRLSEAAVAGKLETRGNPELVSLEFRPIVEGVNATLDAVIGPLMVSAEYVDRIAKGDIPSRITDNYNGDFNEIKNNLNQCIDALSGLVGEMKRMSDEHNAGDIDVVIPVDKFHGSYRDMAEGINGMVGGHIAVKKKAMACIAEFGKGNFEAPLEKFPGKKAFINDTIEQVRKNLQNVSADAIRLADAAGKGELDTRADESRYAGMWQQTIAGMNNMLKGFATPIQDIAQVLQRLARKDFTRNVETKYPGAYGQLRDNVNLVVENIRDAIVQITESAGQFAEGSRVIAESSQSLAAGAQSQSSSVEEMTASIEELARSVEAVRQNAGDANKVATEANTLAEQGGRAVQKSTESMEQIRTSS